MDSARLIKLGNERARSLDVILGLLPLVLGLHLLIWVVYLPSALRGNADFRNCYSAGLILKSGRGQQIYDYQLQKQLQDSHISESLMVLPYVHLPYEALLFAPLAFLGYRSAYFCFLVLNVTCLFGCYWMLRHKLRRLDALWRFLPFLFLIGFSPVPAALMQGQDSLLTLLLFATALISLESGKDFLAGVAMASAIFKFQLVLPVIGLFLFWRRWQFVFGSSLSALIALALSVLVAGTGSLLGYVRSLHEISTKFTAGSQVLYLMPVARMPNIRGLIFSIPRLSSTAATALVLLISLLVVIVAAWAGRSASPPLQFAVAVSTTTLIGYHVLTHDLSILLVSMAVLFDRRDAREFWIIPIVWFAPVVCFFALDYWVTLPLLGFFIFLVFWVRQNSVNTNGAAQEDSVLLSYGRPVRAW